jgi:hypothetical protein
MSITALHYPYKSNAGGILSGQEWPGEVRPDITFDHFTRTVTAVHWGHLIDAATRNIFSISAICTRRPLAAD